MKKNYISNSEESVRMFKNDFLESLSKIHFSVPLFIYVPVIVICTYKAFINHISIGAYALYFVFGILIWTATEYVLHRYIFHYAPKSKWGLRIHFIFHGVHHDYPRDPKRLVMVPSVSLPLAVAFYFPFCIIFKPLTSLLIFFGFRFRISCL
jgi:sterol desaturase/sphingolipid hydroxylase (fatty acid hydroxylase superfamily)